LHANAEILLAQRTSTAFLVDLCSPHSWPPNGLGVHLEKRATVVAQGLREQLQNSRLPDVRVSPTRSSEDHIHAVLQCEKSRYSCLLRRIVSSLADVVEACEGQSDMNRELEVVVQCIVSERTPQQWLEHSYLSTKALASYIGDLVSRLAFVAEWLKSGAPIVVWLSGMFSIPCFLTGTLQTFASQNGHTMDLVEFDFNIPKVEPAVAADAGTFVRGLFLEGCRWDADRCELIEAEDLVVTAECPTMLLLPCVNLAICPELQFQCPVYVVSSRREVFARKSYQRNFVLSVRFPSTALRNHWIARGAAVLTQLDT